MTDYSIKAELDAQRAEHGGYITPTQMQVDLAQGANTEDVPNVGDKAPLFEIHDDEGHSIRLSDYLEKGPVVLSFFRGGWCDFCKIEIKALQRFSGEFEKHNATLIGLAPSLVTVQEFSNGEIVLDYSIFSDKGNKVSKMYGLSFDLSNEFDDLMGGFGLDFGELHGTPEGEPNSQTIPGTFVVNRPGDVIYQFWDYDHTKRAEPTEIIASLMSVS